MGWSQGLFRALWRALSKEVKEHVGTDHLGNKYYFIPEYKNWRGEMRERPAFAWSVNEGKVRVSCQLPGDTQGVTEGISRVGPPRPLLHSGVVAPAASDPAFVRCGQALRIGGPCPAAPSQLSPGRPVREPRALLNPRGGLSPDPWVTQTGTRPPESFARVAGMWLFLSLFLV